MSVSCGSERSPPVFFPISTHFTATLGILCPHRTLAVQFLPVQLSPTFDSRLALPPADALRPIIRITLASSVLPRLLELADAYSSGTVI